MKKHTIINFKILFLLLFIANACRPDNQFSDIPAIRFVSVKYNKASAITRSDTIALNFDFTDGNGDLGLSRTDTIGIFRRRLADGRFNKNYNNLFVDLFLKNNLGGFDSVVADPSGELSLNGRFVRINPDQGPQAQEGNIRYNITSPFFPGSENQIVKLKFYIQDRQLQKSNRLETPEFMINN